MVTKVVTDKDIDNVTIILNEKKQLESRLHVAEVTGITPPLGSAFVITKGGHNYPITKVGRITGTNWLVFQADGLPLD